MSEREQFVRLKLEDENLNDYDRQTFTAELEQIEESKRQNEAIAEEVKTSEFPFILKVGGQEINFRDWIREEVNYQVIAIGVSQKIYELESIHNAQLAERDQLIEQEREEFRAQIMAADQVADAKINELSEKCEEQSFEMAKLNAELALLRTQNHDLRNERDDFERKHQAATSEIDSLKNQLQAAQIKAETPSVTNMDIGALAEAIRKANEAKPRIYNKRAGDSRTSFYLANLLENGEEISIPWTQVGQYVEVSNEEAARFQSEFEAAEAAKQAELESIPENDEPVADVDDFRDIAPPELPDAQSTVGLVGNETVSEGNADSPSGETFEQETRRRLDALEQNYSYMMNRVA